MILNKRILGIFLGVGLLLVGCGKPEEDAAPEENTSPPVQEEPEDETVNEEEEEEVEQFSFHYPLSGEGTNEEINARSVAVMVNNDIHARPQTGLPEADLVFEILTEGNITRFLAIFQSEYPVEVGPVRSARDYFMEIAKGYNSLYIAHGFSPEAKVMSDTDYVSNLNGMYYDGTLFYRSSDRQAPHNSYITFENIKKGAESKKYDMEILPPSLSFLTDTEEEVIAGDLATKITVSYNSSLYDATYEYDSETEKYSRHTNGTQTRDHKSDEAVMLDNIVIMEAPHVVTTNNKGRRDIDFSTGGKAYLVQKGKWREIEWKNVNGQIVPMENGQPAKLAKGKTWINVIPISPGLSQAVTIQSES
ncbi:DUF3048 domain-containing protein [Bacillus carboniphilus]|uniref:DUF3048 domain-containing protein n=1 Tax=Bacillus carboniphilus TaxID=86663 RepID=A0ABN0W8K1_9BACI